jgi:formyltetrahydrofolate deformylase
MFTSLRRYALILRCPDKRGVVAAVAGYLAGNDASIVESSHFNDACGQVFLNAD